MITIEQVQEICDDHFGSSAVCPACGEFDAEGKANESACTKSVVIKLEGKQFCDGLFCPHVAENIRERVAQIPGVTSADVADGWPAATESPS